MTRWRPLLQATATGALCGALLFPLVAAPVLGQGNEAGGLRFSLDVSTGVSASDNDDLDVVSAGDTLKSETRLSFGFASITRNQTLRFSLSDTYRIGDGPGAEFGFRGPNALLSYERKTPNARLELTGTVNTRNVDGDLTDDDLIESETLIVDSGTLTTTNLGFAVETGLQRPFGTAVSLSEVNRSYSGVLDPDLDDSTTRRGTAALVFRPSPVTEARVTYALTEYTEEDAVGTERTTESFGLSGSHQIDAASSLTGSLGWTEITETQTAVPLSLPTESGFTAALGYARQLSAGRLALDLSHNVTSAGERTDASATRVFALPTGSIEVTLGVTKPEGSDLQPTGVVAYTRALPDRRFGVSLSSAISVSSDSVVQRATAASVNYGLELNDRDSLGFDMSVNWVTGVDGSAVTERTRASATARYDRALAQDWTLSTGLTHRLSREAGAGTAQSNTVFVTVGRSFSWRR